MNKPEDLACIDMVYKQSLFGHVFMRSKEEIKQDDFFEVSIAAASVCIAASVTENSIERACDCKQCTLESRLIDKSICRKIVPVLPILN